MVIHNAPILIDTHIHGNSDLKKESGKGRYYFNYLEPENLQEQLEKCRLSGCIVTQHVSRTNYMSKDSRIKEFYSHESNIITGNEISEDLEILVKQRLYKISCHIMYLGKLKNVSEGDVEYGSWLCHATNANDPLKKFESDAKVIRTFFSKYDFKLVESTKGLTDILSIKAKYKNFKVLLGSDSHPDPKSGRLDSRNRFGVQGIMLTEADDFNLRTFIDSLKNNSIEYFQKLGNNFYVTSTVRDKIKVIRNPDFV
ncbi:Uncharacterised protein [Candidatus Tiddalikarchaeum anstoanum]|nr:Uncharacterised protein [Candidatus Tiddalikarchaeum anstoanum]